jgi:hypothetical protein
MDCDYDWTILPAAEFATAQPREPGDLGAEVVAQLRQNGRFMDDMRVTVGSSKILEASFSSADIFTSTSLPRTRLTFQKRPSDIVIRKNATTSAWLDVKTLLQAREIIVDPQEEEEDEDGNADFITLLEGLADPSKGAASVRWAVIALNERNFELVLQSLPAAAATLNSKPILKG